MKAVFLSHVSEDAAANKYRPDIEGLRGVAVLSVMLVHLGFGAFPGGWVGVDVFFVISGFLITRLVRDEIGARTFSFAGFYTRRARRLFPAFIVTVAVTFAAVMLIFDRPYRQRFGGELLYALAGISNFYFWREGGYFSVAAEYKPLLHTWSLGVEEQFYVLWPLTLLLALTYFRRYLWLLLSAAFLFSLLAADYLFYAGYSHAVFFLLPTRVFEFAIGAATVWLAERVPGRGAALEAAVLGGLAMIAASIFGFTESTPFPTRYALLPCCGTALAIYGGTARYSGWLLRNAPLMAVGRISYSLYLVHWPLIVFYKYHRLEAITAGASIAIGVAAIVLAALMYRFIERPIRKPPQHQALPRAVFGLRCTALAILLMIPAAIIWAKGSLLWRGPTTQVNVIEIEQFEEERKEFELADVVLKTEFPPDADRRKLLFVGDSHSRDLATALYLALGDGRHEFAQLRFNGSCFSAQSDHRWLLALFGVKSSCEQQREALEASAAVREASDIIIANYWSEETVLGFDEGIAFLRRLSGARLIVVGQNVTFPTFDTSLRYLAAPQLAQVNRRLFAEQSTVDEHVNEELRAVAARNGLLFIDRQPLVCDRAVASCQVIGPDGKLLYIDRTHWSYEGKRLFGARIAARYSALFAP